MNENEYTAFRVRENGRDQFFQLDQRKNLLDVAKFLCGYMTHECPSGAAALEKSFVGLETVSAKQYDQLMELHLEDPNKVTGVFELDFDNREVSTVGMGRSWQTWSMKDVSAAVDFAYRKSGLYPVQYGARFENSLTGRQISSAGHLSVQDILLAEEICEMDGQRLNFYLEASFDVDAVFGTHVCTGENDDTLNVYADYDMSTGQVCDELEIDLHLADGHEESVEYRLTSVEKATLRRKMDDYCQQQTGQSLKDYSTQLMAEDMEPPTGPTM